MVWTGDVPPLICPAKNPQIKPATVPGVYVLQLVTDRKTKDTYAFLIFVAHGGATVQNVVGPFVTADDWLPFYNALGALGSARPGGFWCDNITEDKPGSTEGFNPREGPKYRAQNRCQGNPHALLAVPSDERLASGPMPPSPPPPDIT
ncbi:MAG TPA: hypothetical protein VFI53_06780, partial [Myxococcaceae bacterium]|nr:hypothetical protein [Myxococcaceae bacterium]